MSGRGMSEKAHDMFTVPLDHDIHMSQTKMGEKQFWKQYGLDEKDMIIICQGLFIASGNEAAALKVLASARGQMKK
jgi:hypothetical protein